MILYIFYIAIYNKSSMILINIIIIVEKFEFFEKMLLLLFMNFPYLITFYNFKKILFNLNNLLQIYLQLFL